MATILVVDDEECIRFTFQSFIAAEGHEVFCAADYDEAIRHVSRTQFDLAFVDIMLDGRTGIDFLRECRSKDKNFPMVMITGYPNVETAAEAVRLGAFDYLAKPIEKESLLRVAVLALAQKKEKDEKESYRVRLDAIFRSVEDAIVTVDDHFVVTEINEGSKKFCCLAPEIIGKDIRTLTIPCTQKCLEPLMETVKHGRSVKAFRLECRHEGDSPQVVNVSTFPLIDRPNHRSGAVMILRNEIRLVELGKSLKESRNLHDLLGKSVTMRKMHALIHEMADLDSTVLITGESGTGKELVAEALHYLGNRCTKPFVRCWQHGPSSTW